MTQPATRYDAATVRDAVIGERFLDLVAELGGQVKRRRGARNLRMPCFLHGGRDANLVVTPASGLWHCMSTCGGGDVFELVELARGIGFAEALAWLGDWAHAAPAQAKPAPVPAKPAKRVDVRPFMSALWDAVADAPLGARALRWLRDERGIEPDAAYGLGCRDWSTRRDPIAALMRSASADVLEAAGFGREASWMPLRSVLGSSDPWAGLAVPAWEIDADAPLRWRWRCYAPPADEPKSRSPIGGGADLLGLGRPAPLPGCAVPVAQLGDVDTMLIVEGEPDWLSATEAVDGRALVVAVCGGASAWRDEWPGFGDLADAGIRRVVACVHRGTRLAPCGRCGRHIHASAERCKICGAKNDPARTDGIGHGERFAADIAEHAAAAGLACRRRLPAESYDLNDRHRAGALRAWLAEVIA